MRVRLLLQLVTVLRQQMEEDITFGLHCRQVRNCLWKPSKWSISYKVLQFQDESRSTHAIACMGRAKGADALV